MTTPDPYQQSNPDPNGYSTSGYPAGSAYPPPASYPPPSAPAYPGQGGYPGPDPQPGQAAAGYPDTSGYPALPDPNGYGPQTGAYPPATSSYPPAYPPAYAQPAYGQPAYGQPAYGAPLVPGYPVGPRNGMGTAALVLGIIGLVLCWNIFGIILGILAVIFGGVGLGRAKRGEANNRGAAMAGLVLGIIAIVLMIVLVIAVVGSVGFSVYSNS